MPTRLRDHLKTLCGGTLLLLAAQGARIEQARAASVSDLESLLWPAEGTLRRDQAGHALTAGRLKDRVVVVSFITTDCAIPCVIRARDLAATARSLPGTLRARVAVLAVSLDPVREGAPALRAFAESLDLDPAQVLVLESDATTAAHQRAALRYPADRTEPPDRVLVFDRTGQLAMTYGATPLDRPRLERDLAELDRFAKGVGHPPTPNALPTP